MLEQRERSWGGIGDEKVGGHMGGGVGAKGRQNWVAKTSTTVAVVVQNYATSALIENPSAVHAVEKVLYVKERALQQAWACTGWPETVEHFAQDDSMMPWSHRMYRDSRVNAVSMLASHRSTISML